MNEEETKSETKRSGVSRREFIAGTVGGVVIGAVVGATAGSLGFPKTVTQIQTQTQTQTQTTTAVSQPWLPASWDYTADVVVVGFGGAGAVASLVAAQAGSKVILIEKMPAGLEGGNTATAGGQIFTPYPVADAVTYLNAMAGPYPIPQDLVQVWATQMGQNMQTLKSIGATPVDASSASVTPTGYMAMPGFAPEWPELAGSSSAHVLEDGDAPGRGLNHFYLLKSLVQKQSNITVLYQTRATSLIQSGTTKEILGVAATTNYPSPLTLLSRGASTITSTSTVTTVISSSTAGSTTTANVTAASGGPQAVNIKASKAVIMALGGFENNAQMLRDYAQIAQSGAYGTPANTGDGIPMVQAVGAALWHMDNVSGAGLAIAIPAMPNGPVVTASKPTNNYIYIGSDSNRFVNETISTRHGKIPFNYQINPTITASTRWVPFPTPFPIHMVFDDTMRAAGPIVAAPNPASGMGYNSIHGLYTWSKDNSTELANGWITKANTLQDLATALGRDPTVLAATVAQYNGYATSGVDAQFGRSKASMAPIQTPPFYAVPLVYTFYNTQGGPVHNTKAQVVDANNNPIRRLYAAGEFGSIYSWCYNGGGNLGETVAFGALAGQNAAAETPWS